MERNPKRSNLKIIVTEFNDDQIGGHVEPGSVELKSSYILLACPGCGHLSGMHVGNPKPQYSPSWLITGVMPEITLTPSINCIGCCGWHGFLINGVFNSI